MWDFGASDYGIYQSGGSPIFFPKKKKVKRKKNIKRKNG